MPASFEDVLFQTAVSLTASLDVNHTCAAVVAAAETVFGARSSWILVHEPETDELVTRACRGHGTAAFAGVRLPTTTGIVGLAFRRREVLFVSDARAETRWFDPDRVRQAGLQSVFVVPIVVGDQAFGVIGVDTPRFSAATPPTDVDTRRLRALGTLAGVGLRNARLFEALQAERARAGRSAPRPEPLRLVTTQRGPGAETLAPPIGGSAAFQRVLSELELVAPADSTVMIVGETGTGKEMVARMIHERSARATRPFVPVNCAALPESLLESELFGHERGAFTGALSRKPGKFELADRGTLFLDEIGDMPLAAQAKLLRALQEHELQRVGGTTTVRIDVRVIAATNQDLATAIQEGRFRSDLFYRLNVFPIGLPPLRERAEDIPDLVRYYLGAFAARQHVRVPIVAPQAMQRLMAYAWPGNIRQLQNVIERAVILARGGTIAPHLLRFAADAPPPAPRATPGTEVRAAERAPDSVSTLFETQRDAILRALRATGWRISGPQGAAALLNLKPTTLHAKMKKLGIRRPNSGGLEARAVNR